MSRLGPRFQLALAVIVLATAGCAPTRPAASGSMHASRQPQLSTSPWPSLSESPSPSHSISPSESPSTSPSGFSGATPCSTTQYPPAFAASQPSSRTLALVTLSGSNDLVVRDITNIDAPVTVANPGIPAYQGPSFVNATELTALSADGIARMPLAGAPQTQGAFVCSGWDVARFSWSRDGRALIYLVEGPDPTLGRFNWHLVANGSDRVIGSAPAWCHCDGETGQDIFDLRIGFSTDGNYVWLVEDVPLNAMDLQIRRLDGTLVTEMKPAASNAISMGVWSGSSLYFRDANGVEVWTNGTVRSFLPGVAWIRPKANPAGGEITYFARGSDGLGHVYVVSTTSGQVTELTTAARTEPINLSPRYIWYQGERLCTTSDPCPFSKTMPTGVTYIFDRLTGTESVSRITAVYDVWPHGS